MTERFARIPARAANCRDLSGRDLRILIAIALHADSSGRGAFPSLAKIAALTGIDRTKVPAAIKRLVAKSLLKATPRRDEAGDAASTIYEVIFDSAGVLPDLGTPVAGFGNTVLPDLGTRGVAGFGTLTDHSINRPPNRQRGVTAEGKTAEEFFNRFWRVYPSRRPHDNPKKPALLKFEAALRRGVDPEAVIRGAENFAAYAAAYIRSPEFIKTAAVWLSQECWNEHQEPPETPRLRAGMI